MKRKPCRTMTTMLVSTLVCAISFVWGRHRAWGILLDCHANGHTNGACHLHRDSRPHIAGFVSIRWNSLTS
jgi:hypothetical protein